MPAFCTRDWTPRIWQGKSLKVIVLLTVPSQQQMPAPVFPMQCLVGMGNKAMRETQILFVEVTDICIQLII